MTRPAYQELADIQSQDHIDALERLKADIRADTAWRGKLSDMHRRAHFPMFWYRVSIRLGTAGRLLTIIAALLAFLIFAKPIETFASARFDARPCAPC